jgi:UDP-N-acetylmuramate--alanine ligase
METHFQAMREIPRHIHFLGIAGIGVSALAHVAQARGVRVSGSDPHADPATNPAIRRLLDGGATLYRAHRAENLAEDADLIVASAAIAEDNPEIQAARKRGVRVVSRAEFLGELMAAHKGVKIAVAGTHGKTTTTAMIGVMLQHAGLDPTVFVGGEVPQLGGNVRIGSETRPFVAEACEAYDSFLYLKPDIAVVTNIEADHLDHYGTFDQVLASFRRFLGSVPGGGPNGGVIVACWDDPGVRQARGSRFEPSPFAANFMPYGTDHPEANLYTRSVHLGMKTSFVWADADPTCDREYTLRVPGLHNVRNAFAAAIVGKLLGVPAPAIQEGLAEFRGVERRQEVLGEAGGVLVMDDYAHHPTEIRATLDSLRSAYPNRRLVAVFQPHLYSRTRDFQDEFAEALAQADALIVTDIYAAREAPLEGVRAADIVNRAIERKPLPAIFLPDRQDIPKMLAALVQPNDLAVFLGAGDIREQGEAFVELLQKRNVNA